MKISIVTAGKIKEKYLREGIEEFTKRLKPFTQIEFIEINEEKMNAKPVGEDPASVGEYLDGLAAERSLFGKYRLVRTPGSSAVRALLAADDCRK